MTRVHWRVSWRSLGFLQESAHQVWAKFLTSFRDCFKALGDFLRLVHVFSRWLGCQLTCFGFEPYPPVREGWRGPLWQINLMSWRSLKWKGFFRRWKEVVLSSLQHVGWRACEMWQHLFFEYCVEPSLFGWSCAFLRLHQVSHSLQNGCGTQALENFFWCKACKACEGTCRRLR